MAFFKAKRFFADLMADAALPFQIVAAEKALGMTGEAIISTVAGNTPALSGFIISAAQII